MTAGATNPLGVMVIDDNPMVCAGLERWLSREPGIGWVGTQSVWQRAETDVRERRPDVVLLDIDLPGTSGLDLIAPLRAACPGCRIVMLSGLVTRELVERAIDEGAAGYVVKEQEARRIVELIRRAAEGLLVLCPTAEAALTG